MINLTDTSGPYQCLIRDPWWSSRIGRSPCSLPGKPKQMSNSRLTEGDNEDCILEVHGHSRGHKQGYVIDNGFFKVEKLP